MTDTPILTAKMLDEADDMQSKGIGVREIAAHFYIAGRADALHEAFLDVVKPEEYTIYDKVRDEAVNG